MRKTICIILLATLILGCAQGGTQKGKTQQVAIGSPFVGGTTGLQFSFQNLRKEAFDSGRDPFDVILKVENKGETLVKKENIRVKLSGINPAEFSKTEAQLTQTGADDSIEIRKDVQGGIIPPPPSFIEFTGFDYKGKITGVSTQFTIRANACYLYKTKAVTKLCVREDLLTPKAGGICTIDQDKTVFNSAGPVQFANFKESTRSKDKIGFTFEVKNAGSGNIFEKGKNCNIEDRKNENKVYVIVSTGLNGVQCTGLDTTQKGAEGWITIYDGTKVVSCTQPISTKTDFEQIINLEAEYDYEQSIQSQIAIKSSGE